MDKLKRFLQEEGGQDIMEYVVIVAFAVTAIAVLSVLYNVIRNKLQTASDELNNIVPP